MNDKHDGCMDDPLKGCPKELPEDLNLQKADTRTINNKVFPRELSRVELDVLEATSRLVLANQDILGGPEDKDVRNCYVLLTLIGMLREKA